MGDEEDLGDEREDLGNQREDLGDQREDLWEDLGNHREDLGDQREVALSPPSSRILYLCECLLLQCVALQPDKVGWLRHLRNYNLWTLIEFRAADTIDRFWS